MNSVLKFTVISCLVAFLGISHVYSQCSASCGTDNAGIGETSCIDIGVPLFGMELGIDAINGNNDPSIKSYLGGDELVNKLDNCCGNEKNCVSIYFTIPSSGGAYSLQEINAIGSGSVYIDCVDLSTNFEEVAPYQAGNYELIFCPPGGSGSKRIGLAPLYEISTTVVNESIKGKNDGKITVEYDLGNPNVSPSGTTVYSIDGIGGSTANTSGEFTDLTDGAYTVTVYDSANSPSYNAVEVLVESGIDCDLNNADDDCDSDGVPNGLDCDPLDSNISGQGSSCVNSQGAPGVIDSNCFCITSGGGTTSGGEGGLESNNRLAQKIASRNFKIKKDLAEEHKNLLDGKIPFNASVSRSNLIDIDQLIPTDLWGAYVANSTPLGLLDITNAIDIVGADFYIQGIRSAVALLIKSEDGVYEHAKYICDRLDGAALENISKVEVKGQELILYEIRNVLGQKEYALSFSGYENEGEFIIENHWNLGAYSKQKEYINFQIWGSSIEILQSLSTSILSNLSLQTTIVDYQIGNIPAVYVMEGQYSKGGIELILKNTEESISVEAKGNYRQTESSEELILNDKIEVMAHSVAEYFLETGNLYDIGFTITDSDGFSDDLFFADGTWGVEDNTGHANVLKFEILPHEENIEGDVLQVERSVYAECMVKGYQNIYRSLTPKWKPVDLSQYSNLAFEARGAGLVEITLVRDSEQDWSKQMRSKVVLTEEKQYIELPLDQFSNSHLAEDLSDVTMVIISILGDAVSSEFKFLHLENLHFNKSALSSLTYIDEVGELNCFPNPATTMIHLNIDSPKTMQVTDLGGKIQSVIFKASEEGIIADVSGLKNGIYVVKCIAADGKASIGKFVKLE